MGRPSRLNWLASLLNAANWGSIGFLDMTSAATAIVLSVIRHNGVERLIKFARHFVEDESV